MDKVFKLGLMAAAIGAFASVANAQSHLVGHAAGTEAASGGGSYGRPQSQSYQQVSAARGFVVGGREDKALILLLPLVAKGFAPAERLLGNMYATGIGVQQDQARAASLYAKAASGSDPYAMYHYGYALDNGIGVARDGDLAMMWMQRASDSGIPELQKVVRNYRQRTGS
jgi:hypothetical protein